jgi:hypothetical protein
MQDVLTLLRRDQSMDQYTYQEQMPRPPLLLSSKFPVLRWCKKRGKLKCLNAYHPQCSSTQRLSLDWEVLQIEVLALVCVEEYHWGHCSPAQKSWF